MAKLYKFLKQSANCLTPETYHLIKASPYADEFSKYKITREENKLRFSSKATYTLFFLELKSDDQEEVVLVGLDGYGMRDKEFRRYVCKLAKKIREATR